MNAAEAAVRHDDDEIARRDARRRWSSTMSSIELGLARRLPAAREVAHELRHRQPLGLGQRRSEHRRDQHLVGAGERAGEVVLEHAPARRRRPRLEDRPDARRRDATARSPASVSATAVG